MPIVTTALTSMKHLDITRRTVSEEAISELQNDAAAREQLRDSMQLDQVSSVGRSQGLSLADISAASLQRRFSSLSSFVNAKATATRKGNPLPKQETVTHSRLAFLAAFSAICRNYSSPFTLELHFAPNQDAIEVGWKGEKPRISVALGFSGTVQVQKRDVARRTARRNALLECSHRTRASYALSCSLRRFH